MYKINFLYRIVRGGNGICDGAVHTGKIRDIIAKCNAAGFSHLQVRFICALLLGVC
jgi:hypothetical protein